MDGYYTYTLRPQRLLEIEGFSGWQARTVPHWIATTIGYDARYPDLDY